MVGELQLGTGPNLRHVATDAALRCDCGLVDYALVAGGAARIVRGCRLIQRSVWVVTGKAGKLAAAVSKTSRAMQISRLMTDIPRIGPVRFVIEIARLAVTGSAQGVEFG